MDEWQAILDAWREDGGARRSAVLATVVHVQGSAYRRPGARMLMLADGRRVGTVSGGCLETEICRKAWWLTEHGRATLRVYDTTSEADAVWEFGLGCNGVVHVLLERVDAPSTCEALAFLAACRAERRAAAIATVIRADDDGGPPVGERLLVADDGRIAGGGLADRGLGSVLHEHVARALDDRASRLVHLDACDVFVECVAAPLSFVIFGAGHDAIPVALAAKAVGWHVTVADGRPAYARAERFPGVDRVVRLAADARLGGIDIDRNSAVVLMTHNFPHDAELLRDLLPHRPRYLGLLGSRQRSERLFAELETDIAAHDVHAPVGLDIGSDTPELIALSIVAEIQAALSGRAGGRLSLRDGPIHSPALEIGAPAGHRRAPVEHPVCALAANDG